MTSKQQHKNQKNNMQDNRNKNRRHSNSKSRPNGRETIEDILPSSQILEKFEDAIPGSVDKLIKMAQQEQEHRHNWQERYLASHNVTYRVGQFFGVAYNAGLLYLVYSLIESGEKSLALNIFSINAAIMVFAILATTIERKIFSRRPSRFNNIRSKRKPQARADQANRGPREPREVREPREPRENRR